MAVRDDYEDGKAYNNAVAEEFRANEGKVGGDWEGRRIMILTTTGAKSGQPHETPLGFSWDGDRMVLSAANGGAPKHPDWYLNLLASPEVTVELGTEKYQATAVDSEGEEYDRLVVARSESNPAFVRNQSRTTRRIPLVWLDRIG
ncbi:MAG TPA: nitroreductase family deazaflavin-dependent oxidoreductase [Acidimicrobiales bacterium]|nr:nitroreductase family deazaflavin-dependent oxidoreductase [Acidimicrobiales bacterium]